MSPQINKLMVEMKKGLTRIYARRLKGVYLFGSYSRDEGGAGSDVDVLIVLDKVDYYSGEIDRTGELVSRVSLDFGVAVSRVFVPERDWREGKTQFFHNIREEAIAV